MRGGEIDRDRFRVEKKDRKMAKTAKQREIYTWKKKTKKERDR